MSEPSVVVVGGGYAGAKVAKLLDDVAAVTLVEPKDAFVHSSAALRAAVDATWEGKVFFSYDNLLARGQIVREYAQAVTPHRVQLSRTGSIDADYLVIATGTAYPFPAKFIEAEAELAKARLARLRDVLRAAERVLLVGAGPVGLELAGELSSAYPGLGITIVDQAADVLTTWDYQPELRDSVRAQLEERGVVFELGSALGYLPPQDVGEAGQFTVHTRDGRSIEAQVWFRCYGNLPSVDYLGAELAAARVGDGGLAVTPSLAVEGFDTVFAIGDVTTIRESKRASAALAHAEVAAANIRALIEGREPTQTYTAAAEFIVLPLGPDGGGSQLVGEDGKRRILGPAETSALKSADMQASVLAGLFGPAAEARH